MSKLLEEAISNTLREESGNSIDLDISNVPKLPKGDYVIFKKKDWETIKAAIDKKEISKLGKIKAIPLNISKA